MIRQTSASLYGLLLIALANFVKPFLSALVRCLGTLIEEEHSGSGNKPRWKRIVVEFLKYYICSLFLAKFLFFPFSTVGITYRGAVHRTLFNIAAGLFGVIFHHILEADIPIDVANQELVILRFERIIPRETPTPLKSLF